jgi:hypothetical protein
MSYLEGFLDPEKSKIPEPKRQPMKSTSAK